MSEAYDAAVEIREALNGIEQELKEISALLRKIAEELRGIRNS